MFNNEQNFSLKEFFSPLTTVKAICIIAVVGIFVFFNSLFNGFVWDDYDYIISNLAFNKFDFPGLVGVNMYNSPEAGFYRIIPALYFAGLHQLFGNNAFFYHAIQIILHIITTILFYHFLKKLLSNNVSFFLSLVFLVHPMNIESVAYIAAGSPSILLFLFGISALLLSVKDRITIPRLLLISALLLLSVLTKETGVFFVLLVPLLRILYRKKQTVALILSALAVLLIYLIMRFKTIGFNYHPLHNFIPIDNISQIQRLYTIPKIIFYYIQTFVFPAKLAIAQNWTVTTPDFQHFFLPMLLDIIFFFGSGLFGFYVYKQNREQGKLFIFFFFWFVIGLGQLLQIVPLDMTVADRWFYFPMAGLLGMLGVGITALHLNSSRLTYPVAITAILLIGILSIRTIVRNANWYDPVTLYTHDIQVQEDYYLEGALGEYFKRIGKVDQAMPHYKKALELNPGLKKDYFFSYWVENYNHTEE